ncbi:MAG: efflux RND transporter periplasmic adaptor subunit [Candidatus Methylacidiphilales bacterium]
MKKFVLAFLIVLVLVGAVVGVKALQIADLIRFAQKSKEAGLPPVAVATAQATEATWERTEQFVGTLRPVQGVTLTAELSGVLQSIDVENGADVQKGQVLMRLDTKQEEAELASAEALLRLAKVNLERAKSLAESGDITQSEYDASLAAFDEAAARVAQWRATINKKVIRAPFAGRVGIRQVNLGQTVKPGDELIPLHQSDPIYVEFAVPQTRLNLIQPGQTLRILSDGLEQPLGGTVETINPVMDETTRTARVQGIVRNPEQRLRAGQFARVEVILPGQNEVIAIPSSAVLTQAFGDSVFVIDESDQGPVARQQFIKLGQRRGDFVQVLQGLSTGDRVVSAGAFKLTNGARVEINDAMQPKPSLDPAVPNT